MPFIGQQPITGAYSKLDAITTSATATYNLLLNGSAYSPASANHLLVSLNGVMQAPQDSFTVSGSTITFASALTSSDNIDFIMALGDVLNIGTPSDGTVTAGKIASGAVTDAKLASTLDLSGKTVTLPTGTGGKVLQVVQGFVGTTATIASSNTNNYADFTGLSASITPLSTSSKILVQVDVNFGFEVGTIHFRVVRGSTAIGVHTGTLGGTRLASSKSFRVAATPYAIQSANATLTHLDSPNTTSATTYKLQGTLGATYNSNMYMNRPYHMGDTNDYNARSSSTIILMEIAA
jgi:hypothetical protein